MIITMIIITEDGAIIVEEDITTGIRLTMTMDTIEIIIEVRIMI